MLRHGRSLKTLCFYLYKMSKVGKALRKQSRADRLLPRAGEQGRWKQPLLLTTVRGPHSGRGRALGGGCCWLNDTVNGLNATELYTFKLLHPVSCMFIYFTIILKVIEDLRKLFFVWIVFNNICHIRN